MVFEFEFLNREKINSALPELFKVLHGNMSLIAPTGGTFEEDFTVWQEYMVTAVREERRQIVLMRCDGELAGYFQYDTGGGVFMMEEIQIKPQYQGNGMFRELYRWLEDKIPGDIAYVEAYSNKDNLKSQGILERLGLERVGENRSGSSYLYRGSCKRLWENFK